jgi:hypothetical protein
MDENKTLQKALQALRVIRAWAQFDIDCEAEGREIPAALDALDVAVLCDQVLGGAK